MEEFRSIARIQVASEDQLAQVPGIGPKIARQIYRYFHPETQAGSPETAQVE
jgi:excinuclease ABC subunit C